MSKSSKGLSRRFEIRGDHVDWQIAIAHYDSERLQEAYETALDIGMGSIGHYLTWFRTIEAEYLTTQRSEVKNVQTFLDLETIPEEISGQEDWIATVAMEAFHSVATRFGYRHESKVRVTVLGEETDAPWLHGRYGYCIAKVGFYKICVPRHLVGNRTELSRTLQHEYAHVVVGTLTQNRAPSWIEEAVAMLAEGDLTKDQLRPFATGEIEWRNPDELEADIRELGDSRDKWEAYLQAGIIGMFLSRNFGDDSVAKMLRGFSAPSYWRELLSRIQGKYSDQSAIERTYRMSVDELFHRTREWVRAGR